MDAPALKNIWEARRKIEPFIHRTPVLTCRAMDDMCGARLFFKCENFQKAGAFKIRGACNTVFSLDSKEAGRGVATHSSGNHAAALALAARWRGIKAFVVMPENTLAVKKKAVAGYGAEIIYCAPTLESREETLADLVKERQPTVIHPYNDHRIIAGQGTAALELCDDVKDLDMVITPVGGGGLLSGTALTVSELSPKTVIMAAEPEQADDAFRSLQAGRIIPSVNPRTIADGLRTSLGELTFPIIQRYVREIITVPETDIIQAMRIIWERMKIIVEPSAAVTLGALTARRSDINGKRIGVILSGGNVDLDDLPWKAERSTF